MLLSLNLIIICELLTHASMLCTLPEQTTWVIHTDQQRAPDCARKQANTLWGKQYFFNKSHLTNVDVKSVNQCDEQLNSFVTCVYIETDHNLALYNQHADR